MPPKWAFHFIFGAKGAPSVICMGRRGLCGNGLCHYKRSSKLEWCPNCNSQNSVMLDRATSVGTRFAWIDRTNPNDNAGQREWQQKQCIFCKVRKHVRRTGRLAADRHIDSVEYVATNFNAASTAVNSVHMHDPRTNHDELPVWKFQTNLHAWSRDWSLISHPYKHSATGLQLVTTSANGKLSSRPHFLSH